MMKRRLVRTVGVFNVRDPIAIETRIKASIFCLVFFSIVFSLFSVVASFAQDRSGSPSRTPGKPGSLVQSSPVSPKTSQPPILKGGVFVPAAAANSVPLQPTTVPNETKTAGPQAEIASSPLIDSPARGRSLLDKPLPPPTPNSIVVATEAEKNQKIVEGWEKPWACLFLTGRQHGYIEPCGCTGLENQKGGLNRRDTLLTSIVNRGWDVLPIDIGDQVRRIGRQSEVKFARTAEALKLMNYQAIMYGPDELKLSSSEVLLPLTDMTGNFKSPFVAANVEVMIPDAVDRFKVIQVGNRRIGITGVLGDDMVRDVPPGDIKISRAEESLAKVVPKLQAAKCDFLVLIAHTNLQTSSDLATKFPIFDLVVTAGGYGEPTYKPEPVANTKTVVLQVGTKGMYAGIVGLYDSPNEKLRYQRVALSSQFEDSPRIMEIFAKYQKELEQLGLSGLGLRPFSHPTTREFVGTEKCGECHSKALEVWKNSPHAHATDSIVTPPGRGDVPRHFDPECIACHVTGWKTIGSDSQFHPNPYVSGFVSLEKSPHLTGSGCENCHGPGSQHVAAEEGLIDANEELMTKLRREMQLPLASAKYRCLECHDIDNSPAFHEEGAFEEYWKRIEHNGKD
jgi:Cytochrome c554 and c-prime